jgi:Zn-dependent protease/predicted transcriptional regulator
LAAVAERARIKRSKRVFKYKLTLFKLLGFKIEVDASWLLLASLITWTLATGYFPANAKGLAPQHYWTMGLLGMLGLFLSLILHELAHSLVARRYDLPIRGITLFLFGGVAALEREPVSPSSEFWIAVAGPAASIALAVLFWLVAQAGPATGLPAPLFVVFGYLSAINLVLFVFNLVPGFPLDGGRVLRALLWWWKGDLRWATRLASKVGDGFGLLLIVLGVVSIVYGQMVTGIWSCLIGLFVRQAAIASYSQLVTGDILSGHKVAEFMTRDIVTVPSDIAVSRLIDDFVLVYNHTWFPVLDGSVLRGGVHISQFRQLTHEQRRKTQVSEIATPVTPDNSIGMETPAIEALKQMSTTGNRKLLVIENGRLAGILALSDLLKFIALRTELSVE